MWIQAFHNADGKEEFGEKPYISLPKKAFCEFMKTSYKERLYPLIKDYSNLPNPDDCPVKAVTDKNFFGDSAHVFLIDILNCRIISLSRIIHSMPVSTPL